MLPTSVVRGRKNPLCWAFAERLGRTRRAARLLAASLSVAAGLNKNAVAQLEEGVGSPRVSTVEQLARVLGISPAWLGFGLGEITEPAEPGPLRCSALAQRTVEIRSALGLSVREADRRAGGAEGVVRSVERGSMPALDTVEDLARGLGVSPAWLVYGQGPRELPGRGSRSG